MVYFLIRFYGNRQSRIIVSEYHLNILCLLPQKIVPVNVISFLSQMSDMASPKYHVLEHYPLYFCGQRQQGRDTLV